MPMLLSLHRRGEVIRGRVLKASTGSSLLFDWARAGPEIGAPASMNRSCLAALAVVHHRLAPVPDAERRAHAAAAAVVYPTSRSILHRLGPFVVE